MKIDEFRRSISQNAPSVDTRAALAAVRRRASRRHVIKVALTTVLTLVLAGGLVVGVRAARTHHEDTSRISTRPGPSTAPAVLFALDDHTRLVSFDLATSKLQTRHLDGLAGGDPPFPLVVRGDQLVYWGRTDTTADFATWVVPTNFATPPRMLDRALYFVPSASPDRLWLVYGEGSSRSPVAVREVMTSGVETVPRTTLPAGSVPDRGAGDGLLLQRDGQLQLWSPIRGVEKSFNGSSALDANSNTVVWFSGDGALHVQDLSTGGAGTTRTRGAKGFGPGAISPDGSHLAVMTGSHLAVQDIPHGSIQPLVRTSVPNVEDVTWTPDGQTVILRGHDGNRSIVGAFSLGSHSVRRLPVDRNLITPVIAAVAPAGVSKQRVTGIQQDTRTPPIAASRVHAASLPVSVGVPGVVDGGSFWTTSSCATQCHVVQIDLATNQIVSDIPPTVGDLPEVSALAVGDGAYFTLSNDERGSPFRVTRVDRSSTERTWSVPIVGTSVVGSPHARLAFGAGALWFSDGTHPVLELSPRDGSTIASFPVDVIETTGDVGFAFARENAWAVGSALHRFDPATNAASALAHPTIDFAQSLAADRNFLWLTHATNHGGELDRINARSPYDVLDVGIPTHQVAAGNGGVWYLGTAKDPGQLGQIDPATGRLLGVTRLPIDRLDHVQLIAINGSAFVIDSTARTVTRVDDKVPSLPGRIKGVLSLDGGPAPGLHVPSEGVVTARTLDGRTYTAHANSRGQFTMRVPAGLYTLTGTSPRYNDNRGGCSAFEGVSVAPGRASSAAVICQMK